MKRRIVCLFLCVLFLAVSVFAEGEPSELPQRPVITNSSMALLYEESTDTYLYAKKPDYANPPASMTKVMTAVLVLEHDPELAGTATVSSTAVSIQSCSWMTDNHLLAGEELSVWDLMNYLLIPSGNEAGTVLAEYVAGSIPAFLTMMNDKAKELGMTQTHYADPHGLSEINRITCEDMLILCRYAMQFENFRKIVSTKQGILPANSVRPYAIRYSTTNRVMNPKGVSRYDTGFSEDIIGIKTGYISLAGNNLACCMIHGDLTFYSVVMHAHDEQQSDGSWLEGHYMDTRDLMVWARSFRKAGFTAGEQVAVISTALSPVKNLPLVAAEDVCILTRQGSLPRIILRETDFSSPKNGMESNLLTASMPTIPSFTKPPFTVEEDEPAARVILDKAVFSVKAGDRVGRLVLEDGFGNVRETPLLAAADAATSPLMLLIPAAALLAALILLLAKRKKKN
ncbi:MAG: D-alanyl-D-alanine carboxypeptidase [Clostridia bacterium]|nr:D-alanyl-D-alanine carboxypeptidase [Clostridia bacterium]